jgi:hypothetical protein
MVLALSLTVLAELAEAQRGGRGGRGGGRGGFGRGAANRPVAGHGIEVPGWWGRTDRPGDSLDGLKFVEMNDGLHATTGPNMILWDPDQVAEAPYTVKATFTVAKPPSHPVAYGLFIGGENLAEDNQSYTYFVIRENNQFLIKKRTGATTSNVAGDWASHPSIMARAAEGQRNELSIQVGATQATFMINGMQVATHPVAAIDAAGVVGLRIGHVLDVQIDGFEVDSGQ